MGGGAGELRTLPAFSAARALRSCRSSLLPALASVGGDGARAEHGEGGRLRTLPASSAAGRTLPSFQVPSNWFQSDVGYAYRPIIPFVHIFL